MHQDIILEAGVELERETSEQAKAVCYCCCCGLICALDGVLVSRLLLFSCLAIA